MSEVTGIHGWHWWDFCKNKRLLPKQLQGLPFQGSSQVSQPKKKTYPGLPQTIGFSRTIHGFLCAVWSQKAKAGCDNNADSLGVPHWCQPDTTGQHGAAVHGIFTEESKKKKVKLLLAISCIRGRKQRKYLKILHCLPLRSS